MCAKLANLNDRAAPFFKQRRCQNVYRIYDMRVFKFNKNDNTVHIGG